MPRPNGFRSRFPREEIWAVASHQPNPGRPAGLFAGVHSEHPLRSRPYRSRTPDELRMHAHGRYLRFLLPPPGVVRKAFLAPRAVAAGQHADPVPDPVGGDGVADTARREPL